MSSKGKTPHSSMLIFSVIVVQLVWSTTAQYDDDISQRKVRLQDLENEQDQRDHHRQELMRLHQQRPPMQSSLANLKSQLPFAERPPIKQSVFHGVAPSVRPLEQFITAAKPFRPGGIDYASAAASSFNFGISPLANNGIGSDFREDDVDTDVISYSHDSSPLPVHLHRPQLELLSAGGAGYALMSSDVLVPPFREDQAAQIPDERRELPKVPPGRFPHPYQLGNNLIPSPYAPNPAIAANGASRPHATSGILTNNDIPDAHADTIEYSSGYLPLNQQSSQRPVIQYGSPHADFRRPSFYPQSNQFAYSPIRPGSNSGPAPNIKVPFPPSFISITTRRPAGLFNNGNETPQGVRPLGRSLGYEKPFRPSAVDPVPDFFSNRQPKSLLDSYIPSWVIARMLEQQRNHGFPSEQLGNNVPFNRYLKRSDTAQSRKDDMTTDKGTDEEKEDKKIVKKSSSGNDVLDKMLYYPESLEKEIEVMT